MGRLAMVTLAGGFLALGMFGLGCENGSDRVEEQGEVPAIGLPSGFSQAKVADISNGTAMAFAPDGRIFVTEQTGRLRVIKNGALLSAPFVSLNVDPSGERGLLGVAIDPNFSSNHYIYLYYTVRSPAHNRVSRFVAAGDVAAGGSETVLFELDNLSSASNHNGGALAFGPGGKLFVAVGENNDGANAQKMTNVLGKILRLNSDGSIPTDNPFYGTASGKNRAIWALGLRNPFTFTFQPDTYRMFINDVGQNAWEEIDDGQAGANYGWPTTEGATSDSRFRSPVYSYGHTGGDNTTIGCAITGGTFYNPSTAAFGSGYVGKYFFADFCNNWIRVLDPSARTAAQFATGVEGPVSLQAVSDGSLYYLARGGSAGVYRITVSGTGIPQITAQPQAVNVAVGQAATFSVSATGAAPLRYQWQRNGSDISGATSASYTIPSAAAGDNNANFRVVVSNNQGSATSNAVTLRVISNAVPVASINSPTSNSPYSGGETIRYTGEGTDAEDGKLQASRFTWKVDFHHDTHIHPFIASTSGSKNGSFVIPTRGETSANVWYRIHLTVTDSANLQHSTFVDIKPRTAIMTLASTPNGMQVTLDGQPVGTPTMVTGVVGVIRTLGVVVPQSLGGSSYVFDRWSDGGAATHEISTPTSNRTYTATYKTSGGSNPPPPPPPPPPSGGSSGMTRTIIFQDGASPAGYSGTRDTTILQSAATTNYGATNTVRADGEEPQDSSNDSSILIKWDLASWIPVGSRVTKVELTVTVHDPSWATYSAYRLLRSWDERTANWNLAAAGAAWGAAGANAAGDVAPAPLATLTTNRTDAYTVSLSSAAALAVVQDWVNTPGNNYGLVIRNSDPADGFGFRSRETKREDQRPKLTVTYIAP